MRDCHAQERVFSASATQDRRRTILQPNGGDSRLENRLFCTLHYRQTRSGFSEPPLWFAEQSPHSWHTWQKFEHRGIVYDTRMCRNDFGCERPLRDSSEKQSRTHRRQPLPVYQGTEHNMGENRTVFFDLFIRHFSRSKEQPQVSHITLGITPPEQRGCASRNTLR